MGKIILYVVIGYIFILIFVLPSIILSIKKSNFKFNSKQIKVGMTKQEVINLMGSKFSKSVEKNGDEIYEWVYRISGGGVIYAPNGVGIHSNKPGYSMLVAVTFNNNKVVAIALHNMD